jgi:hypothetical protein
VIGFHGCDRELGLRLLQGSAELRPSTNPWDWLGPGIYFWEQNPYRALSYAEEAVRKRQKFAGKIETPFVIGAIIDLGKCLNLIEPRSINVVKEAYDELLLAARTEGNQLPVNKGPNRQLDCAVIKILHASYRKKNIPPYDTIRSPFHEGGPIYSGANFTDRLHIELCILNPHCIKGYFLPRPVQLFNPYLQQQFRA